MPLCLLGGAIPVLGAWSDRTAGLPFIETVDTRAVNPSEDKWIVTQDRWGRLFTSDNQVHMLDGQQWHSFAVPGTYAVRTLHFDEQDRLWITALNEVGFFEEKTPGGFAYHSLAAALPKGIELGQIWNSTQVERSMFFVCDQMLLRWDGERFQTWSYETQKRLYPVSCGNETWFHHVETGLYRLTANGPVLAIPASELPAKGIFGLIRHEQGWVVVSSQGFFHVGQPLRPVISEEFNQQLSDASVSSFTSLPDGYGCIGTINNGLFLIGPHGFIRHLHAATNGLPARAVLSLRTDSTGRVWGTAHNSIFSFDGTGAVSGFDARNGLNGSTVRDVRLVNAQIHAVNVDGVQAMNLAPGQEPIFQNRSLPKKYFYRLEPFQNGFMAARYRGIDFFEGKSSETVVQDTDTTSFRVLASRKNDSVAYSVGSKNLEKITADARGRFSVETLAPLPDEGSSLHEDTSGQLWIGTATRGVLTYRTADNTLRTFAQPTVQPGLSSISVAAGTDSAVFLFLPGVVYVADADGSNARKLAGVPPFEPKSIRATPDGRGMLISFSRVGIDNLPTLGLGLLTLEGADRARWTEFDPTVWQVFGVPNGLEFSREGEHELVWVAGSNGLGRIERAVLEPAKNPPAPLLRADAAATASDTPRFAFKDHRVKLHVNTGDYWQGKNWFYQWRFTDGEWSQPLARNTYEFTNLSEGNYGFEVRAVTPGGLAGPAARYTFEILPPWYRSGWAYGSYGLAALGAGVVVVRARERRSQRRTRELETLVKIRTQELEKASAAKDEFLAGISHEIRNPMNGVIGIAESFPTETLDAESRHKFGLLRQCANHLSSLLEEILDFSRVQAGLVDLESTAFNPHELVESVAAITASESKRRGIAVEAAISPAVPTQVIGAPRRVRQILLNLVGNALKFAGRGKIEVTVWCKAAQAGHTELYFTVADEGPGIPASEQEKIFARFERGASALADRLPGTGLGLALCKALAEKMRGRLWVESEPGHGACFYFVATFAVGDELPPPVPAEQILPAPINRRALVVDDEEYNRVALTDLLDALGFVTETASDGATALSLAKTQHYAVIFLDYHLPGMNGLEIARALRGSSGSSARTPIVATTAFTTAEKRAECLAAGMTTFLAKPVTLTRLRTVVGVALNDPVAAASAQPPMHETRPHPADAIRALAAKKGVSFATERALFLEELSGEHAKLLAALARADSAASCEHAHRLYGRFGFVGAKELELLTRKIETAAATSDWSAADQLASALTASLGEWQQLMSSAPATDPAG